MGKLVVTEFMTLDGVIDDPGGAEGSPHGGWAFRFERGEEGDKFKWDELMAADAQLLGRRTYEGFAEAWPSREGPFADKINSTPKYVVSTTLERPSWENTTVLQGDLREAVESLKQRHENILVAGSAQLVQALVELELVDELRLMVFPVVVGGGKRLFGDTSSWRSFRLVDSMPAGETVLLTFTSVRST